MSRKSILKTFLPFALASILMVLMAGCNAAVTNNATDGTPKKPSVPVKHGNISNLKIDRATDEFISGYSSFYEYGNGAKKIVVWTDKTIRDFAFISVALTDSLDYFSDGVLFLSDALNPEKPLIAQIDTADRPQYGISFLDNDNKKKYFYIHESGIDGSLSFVEFENNAN